VVPTEATAAQATAQAIAGRRITNLEIGDALRSSGLTQAQVRDRLARSGYDPGLADPFFAADASAPNFQAASANSAFAAALSEVGILTASADNTDSAADAERLSRMKMTGGSGGVFGKALFASRGSLFDPVTAGPVDPSYRLGVGDLLQVVLTGEVEAVYPQLDIRRDGTILLPQLGQVTIAGLTLEAARLVLRDRAATLYSGINSGRTRIDLSLGRIRSIQVYVIGDVEAPGAYQVSALGTVFTALARAGGPSNRGTFRRIEVRRAGQLARTVDLYDYLLAGDASQDVRLEQGDIIFVPMTSRNVSITGAVRRTGLFELRAQEGFKDLLRFAGGFSPVASFSRLQVDRVLPLAERKPGRERVVLDVDLTGGLGVLDTLKLNDSDVIGVFSISDLRRDRIVVTGEVQQPGAYQWRPNLTVDGLLQQAEGTLPWALTDRVKLYRPVVQTGRVEIVNLNLADSAARHFPVFEFDSLVVLDGRLMFPSGSIQVTGSVNRPGIQQYVEGQSLRDVFDVAGGPREDAAVAEVARRVRRAEYSDTSAVVYRFELDSAFFATSSKAFIVERGDVISVRSKPGYRVPGTVSLEGEFRSPGTYALRINGERLSDVIGRAGGLLPTAQPEGFRLLRNGRVVVIDLPRALRGDKREDVTLVAGDLLRMPRTIGTVSIGGGVRREVVVPFNSTWGLSDYLAAAGGLSPRGDKGAIIVEYASGKFTRRRTFLGLALADPQVRPGATINVGVKEPAKETWRDTLTTVAQLSSVIVSLVVAWSVARK
jgi:protein involved in polysaccharide export with SLBB domain